MFTEQFHTLDEYKELHDRLIRGMRNLDAKEYEFLSQTEGDFVTEVREAHFTLFEFAMPKIAGRLRLPHEPVSYGGEGRHKREGAPSHLIEERLGAAFRFACAQNEGWNYATRSATFLASFFRVHPFLDGNGRVGRLIVKKICRREGFGISSWSLDVADRGEYVKALEYAHQANAKGVPPEQSSAKLAAWIERRAYPIVEDEFSMTDVV